MVNGNGHPLPQCLSRPSPKRVPRAWGFVQSSMTFGDRRVEGPLILLSNSLSIRTARSSLTQSTSDPSRFAALRKASKEATQWLDKSNSLIERGGRL